LIYWIGIASSENVNFIGWLI
jgi:hypothetical protein